MVALGGLAAAELKAMVIGRFESRSGANGEKGENRDEDEASGAQLPQIFGIRAIYFGGGANGIKTTMVSTTQR